MSYSVTLPFTIFQGWTFWYNFSFFHFIFR